MSFILIGLGRETSKDLGETGQEQQCVWCSDAIFYHLILVRTWLTCFLIPLFAYRSKYHVACPSCLCSIEIRGNEIQAAKLGELRLRSHTTE